jgi:S-adenosylmethionine:tRNA ribosyltransferase-isomerase
MRLSELDYALPSKLIAQEPAAERASARLLVVEREGDTLRHAHVLDLPGILRFGDLLVLNDTRVIPARVRARRPSGGRLEVLFIRALGRESGHAGRPGSGDVGSAPHGAAARALHGPPEGDVWEALVRGAPRAGERVHLPDASGEWVMPLGDGRWHIRLETAEPAVAWLDRIGEVPLPPYIRRPDGAAAADRERYQTVFARVPGAVAAPTAGLHFTPALLDALGRAGIEHAFLTLHVGPGTFLPIRTDDLAGHRMLSEPYVLPEATASRIHTARAAGRRIVAVGTTSVRALESAAVNGELRAGPGDAALFIRPGHRFHVVDALLTNFHLPRTPLLALVAALAGWERIQAAYEEAVRQRYRFYSFGDAMLIT